MEENLTAAGLENGVEGLLGTMAMMGILYPMIEGLTGASPGKWLLGLRVANADGQPGGLLLYMKRFSIKFIRPLLIALGALSGVSALGWMSECSRSRNQSRHTNAVGTPSPGSARQVGVDGRL